MAELDMVRSQSQPQPAYRLLLIQYWTDTRHQANNKNPLRQLETSLLLDLINIQREREMYVMMATLWATNGIVFLEAAMPCRAGCHAEYIICLEVSPDPSPRSPLVSRVLPWQLITTAVTRTYHHGSPPQTSIELLPSTKISENISDLTPFKGIVTHIISIKLVVLSLVVPWPSLPGYKLITSLLLLIVIL